MVNKSLWQRLAKAKPTLLQDPYLMAELRSDPMVMRTYPDPSDAVEAYLRFLYLAATQKGGAVPNKAVDALWHAHLANTRAYETFCKTVIGKFIHHTPSVRGAGTGDPGLRDRFFQTQDAERREFSQASLEANSEFNPGWLALAIGLPILTVAGTAGLIRPMTATVLLVGLVAVYVLVKIMTQPVSVAQPAGHPDPRRKTDSTDSGSSGGGETFYLSGLPGDSHAAGGGHSTTGGAEGFDASDAGAGEAADGSGGDGAGCGGDGGGCGGGD